MNYFPVSLGQHDFKNFSMSWLILKEGGFTPMLDNQKGMFPLKRAFLADIQQAVERLSNQISSFRIKTR